MRGAGKHTKWQQKRKEHANYNIDKELSWRASTSPYVKVSLQMKKLIMDLFYSFHSYEYQ